MSDNKTFYYSRKKLADYLLLNLFFLLLGITFVYSLLPEFKFLCYLSIVLCVISLISSFIVFIKPFKLAEITPQFIKIDHNAPIFWQDIKKLSRFSYHKSFWAKNFLKIEIHSPEKYHMSFMQKISKNSKFGAFSIPLYAMDDKEAKLIELIILNHLKNR